MTAAGLDDVLFEDADDFRARAVVMPPGKRVNNPFTLVQASVSERYSGSALVIAGACWASMSPCRMLPSECLEQALEAL